MLLPALQDKQDIAQGVIQSPLKSMGLYLWMQSLKKLCTVTAVGNRKMVSKDFF